MDRRYFMQKRRLKIKGCEKIRSESKTKERQCTALIKFLIICPQNGLLPLKNTSCTR
jgi:hypothetical protein